MRKRQKNQTPEAKNLKPAVESTPIFSSLFDAGKRQLPRSITIKHRGMPENTDSPRTKRANSNGFYIHLRIQSSSHKQMIERIYQIN
nr:hypothetical protein Iba_chr04dCG18660 [Ipomoea batatas]